MSGLSSFTLAYMVTVMAIYLVARILDKIPPQPKTKKLLFAIAIIDYLVILEPIF